MVAEVVPLKQGLKLSPSLSGLNSTLSVAEVVPLKQGLKHIHHFSMEFTVYLVAEVVPLKQGLKHDRLRGLYDSYKSCRGSSIKTRIETWL